MNQTQLRFTDERMAAIKSVASHDWQQAIVDAYKGFGIYLNDDDCPPVDPKKYALPADQWKEIAAALADSPNQSPITAVNRMLTWVNIGPSSFEGVMAS